MPRQPDDEELLRRTIAAHQARVREGHKTPEWDNLSPDMQQWLVHSERDKHRRAAQAERCIPSEG